MIRPFTLVTMILAAVSGAYLFAVKHRAQVLDNQLAQTAQQSRLDEQRIRVLQAQWALEIDPARLNGLAAQFTTLQPMKPAQLVTLAALRDTLPPPGSTAPGSNPIAPAPVMPVTGQGAAAPVAQAAPVLPLPPPEPPVMVVNAVQHNVTGHPATVPHPAAPRLAARQVSHSVLPMASRSPVKSLPPPAPLYASTQPSLPMGTRLVAVKASAEVTQIASGSVLGMAADLPPPQPLPANGSGN